MWNAADEYPDDDRNLPAAEHLADLARQILALPDDDPRILRMESAVQAIIDGNGELAATSEIDPHHRLLVRLSGPGRAAGPLCAGAGERA